MIPAALHAATVGSSSQQHDVVYWFFNMLRDLSSVSASLAAIYHLRRNVKSDNEMLRKLRVTKSTVKWAPRIEGLYFVVGVLWSIMLIVGGILAMVSTSDINYMVAHGMVVVTGPTHAAAVAFWLQSLWAARSTCRAALERLEELIKETNPLNAAKWDKEVGARALELAHVIMPTINEGWSPVVAFISLQCLMWPFCSFALIKLSLDAGRAKLEAEGLATNTTEAFYDIAEAAGPDFVGTATSMVILSAGQLWIMTVVLFVPMVLTRKTDHVLSALNKKEFQLLVAQEGPSETDDERRYRHERVSALAALHRALSSTSKFGFNVFGVRVTLKLWVAVASSGATVSAFLLSSTGTLF